MCSLTQVAMGLHKKNHYEIQCIALHFLSFFKTSKQCLAVLFRKIHMFSLLFPKNPQVLFVLLQCSKAESRSVCETKPKGGTDQIKKEFEQS